MLGRALGGFLAFGAVLLLRAPSSRAQDAAPGDETPRKAPRLEYKRGPAECLPELEFRREVAIAGDGVDRFDATGTDVMLVRFERTARGYRGTIEFTTADGTKRKPKIEEHANCEILGRWVGVSAYYYFPPRPEPAAVEVTKPDPVPSKEPAWVPPLPIRAIFEPLPPRPSSSLWDAIRKMDLTIGLYAYALMTVGLTANVGPGFGIAGDIRGEVFSVGVEIRGVLPGYTESKDPIDPTKASTPGHFDLSQWTGLLVPCGRYKYFVGCGVAQAGVFTLNSDSSGLTARPALSFGPRLGFEIPFAERFAVFGFGEALFAAVREGYDNPTYNHQWRPSIVAGFFGAGLSATFK